MVDSPHLDGRHILHILQANSTGRNSKTVREYLEKNWADTSGEDTVRLAIKALLEVSCIFRRYDPSVEQFIGAVLGKICDETDM